MPKDTTIRVTSDVKAELDSLKQSDESYNAVIDRLVSDSGTLWTESEIESVVDRRLEQMQSSGPY